MRAPVSTANVSPAELHDFSASPYATLFGLIQHYSPTGQEAGAASWLVARMLSLGYRRAFTDEAGNAVGVLGEGPRQALLLGHIDTVPGEIAFKLQDGKVYGRGSVDAKGALAAFVDAVARAGPQPGWQIVVVGAVDEEGDSAGARHLIDQYQPEWVVVGEPSRWERITLGYKGSAWAEVSLRAALAHSAGPGQSAAERVVGVWQRAQGWVEEYNAGNPRLFDQVLLRLSGLFSEEDGFEEHARLRIGARLPASISPERWYVQLARLAGEVEIQPVGYAIPAYRADKNTALVRAMLSAIRQAGGNPNFALKTGTADLNIVAPAWGCPAVAYGPGDSSLDHTPEEHLELEEYDRAVRVLEQAVLKLCP